MISAMALAVAVDVRLPPLPPCVTRFGRAWPALLVMMPENWYSEVGSPRAGPSLGPKSTGRLEVSDMLLGWAVPAAWVRACESVGDDGVLNTCLAAGSGVSTSSMLRTGCS